MAYPSGWISHKVKIDITGLSLSADVSNYPYLLTESAFLQDAFLSSDDGGGDLRFSSDAAGTSQIPFEIVTWNTSTKKAEVWVKIPTVDHDAPFYIYVWYDNTGVSPIGREIATMEGLKDDANLKGYWKLESDGTDETANDNDLTAVGDPTHATGKFGNGVDLERGSSQYYTITDANQTGLDITGDISISCWVKFESLDVQQGIVSKYDYANDKRGYYFYITVDNAITFSYSGDGINLSSLTLATSSYGSLSTGVWNHIAVSMDVSAKKGSIAINGVVYNIDATGTQTSIYDNAINFAVGCRFSNDDPTNLLDGVIDDVAVYNRILSDDELISIYGSSGGVWGGYEAVYHKPTVYTCDFEEAADLDDWTLVDGALSDTHKKTGDYSLKLSGNGSRSSATYFLENGIQKAYASLYFYINNYDDAYFFFRGAGDARAYISIAGDLYYRGPDANVDTTFNVSTGAWHRLEVVVDTAADTLKLIFDDTNTTGVVDAQAQTEVYKFFNFTNGDATADLWIDDFYCAYAKDSTGNQRDGSAGELGITSVEGKIGNAIDFDTSYIDTGHEFNPGTGDFCVSSWISMDSVAAAVEDIIDNYDGTKWWLLGKTSEGTLSFKVDDDIGMKNAEYALANFSADTPYFIQGIRDAGTGNYLNVNGIQRGTDTDAGNDVTSTLNTRFGVRANSETDHPFAGRADETRIKLAVPTADWTKLDYNTQNSPGSYVSAIKDIFISDSLSLSDPIVGTSDYKRSVQSSLGLSDTIARISDYKRSVQSSLGISDTVSYYNIFTRELSDNFSVSDVVSRVVDYQRINTDSITVNDSISRIADYKRSTSSSLGVTDSIVRTLDISRVITDSISIDDVIDSVITTGSKIVPELLEIKNIRPQGDSIREIKPQIMRVEEIKPKLYSIGDK